MKNREEWEISQSDVTTEKAGYWESIFALANGKIGLRGADFRHGARHYPGSFSAGFYGYRTYQHEIEFPGFPRRLHAQLRLPDWTEHELRVNGQPLSSTSDTRTAYRRALDLRNGVLKTYIRWNPVGGIEIEYYRESAVSMVQTERAVTRTIVTVRGGSCDIDVRLLLRRALDSKGLGRTGYESHGNVNGGRVSLEFNETEDNLCRYMVVESEARKFNQHGVAGQSLAPDSTSTRDSCEVSFAATAQHETRFQIDQVVNLSEQAPGFDCEISTSDSQPTSVSDRVSEILDSQKRFWNDFWSLNDIEIAGNAADQVAIRFAIFHLRQSLCVGSQYSISANGLSGDGYMGHVFWDTEIYMCPFFLLTESDLCRTLLEYRHRILPEARRRAKELEGEGALYAWNSITGEECSLVYEASTAQYHLNCDIAYAIWQYYMITGDNDFLFRTGSEVLFETARFIRNRGAFVPTRDGEFCLNVVCGPDEYACGVDNNCFTNAMAQFHLRFAVWVYRFASQEHIDDLRDVCQRVSLSEQEVNDWESAATAMRIPYNDRLGVHAQDDTYLYRDPVDMENVPRHVDIRTMHHPLNLWRKQVSKQADVVLLMFLLGFEFSLEDKSRNYDFYEPRTNHGSSLSPGVHSIIANEIGRGEEAYRYFRISAHMDLEDVKNNTSGGVHAACLGITWQAVVFGFAGLRITPDRFLFAPTIPRNWTGYRFQLTIRRTRICVHVTRSESIFRVVSGKGLSIWVYGSEIHLRDSGAEVSVALEHDSRL